MLSADRIETIASGDNVNRTAVENFLASVDDSIGYQGNVMNVAQDARAYDWNIETQVAIRLGLLEHFFGANQQEDTKK